VVALRRPAGEAAPILANGSVEGTEVVLSAKVPGRLLAVTEDEGATISSGAILVRMESDDVRAQAQAADARVTAAAAQVVASSVNIAELQRQVLEASLAQSYASASTTASITQAIEAVTAEQHAVHAATAAFVKARDDFARISALHRTGDISTMEFEAYRTAYENASAQLDEARQGLAQAQTAIAQARTGNYQVAIRSQDIGAAKDRIRGGQAALDVARAQYHAALAQRAQVAAAEADTVIRAPSSGTILRVIAHTGEVVAAGAPILTMTDLRKLYVRVYVSEQDMAQIHVGDHAAVTVDAFPNHRFSGNVASIDQFAQFTPKTVHMPDERTRLVYGVRVALVDPQGLLKPGMVADAQLRRASPKP
jgi:HlyD family secretion protein